MSLRHRMIPDDDPGADGLQSNNQRNIMGLGVPGTKKEDFDLIQAYAISGSKV